MHMSYWFGTAVGDLLFEGFTVTSTAAVVMTCFGLASLAILFEAIRVYHAHVKHSTLLRDEHCHSSRCTNERTSLLGNDRNRHISFSHKLFIPLCETGWYVVQDVLSYILMLCIMTYNGYFIIAVSVGAGIGYLLFSPVLLEIGLKNGGICRPKRVCPVCMEASRNEEDVQEGAVLPAVAQRDSLVHQSNQDLCHESVAVVHRSDI